MFFFHGNYKKYQWTFYESLWKGVRWSFVKKFFSNKITVSRSSFRGVFQRYISKYLIGIIRKIYFLILSKKCPYLELFWSVFSCIGLNTERYGVSLRIQHECRKMRTRITPDTNTFHAAYWLHLNIIVS